MNCYGYFFSTVNSHTMSIINILVTVLAIRAVHAVPWSWDEPSIKLPVPASTTPPFLGPNPTAAPPVTFALATKPNNTNLFNNLFLALISIKRF